MVSTLILLITLKHSIPILYAAKPLKTSRVTSSSNHVSFIIMKKICSWGPLRTRTNEALHSSCVFLHPSQNSLLIAIRISWKKLSAWSSQELWCKLQRLKIWTAERFKGLTEWLSACLGIEMMLVSFLVHSTLNAFLNRSPFETFITCWCSYRLTLFCLYLFLNSPITAILWWRNVVSLDCTKQAYSGYLTYRSWKRDILESRRFEKGQIPGDIFTFLTFLTEENPHDRKTLFKTKSLGLRLMLCLSFRGAHAFAWPLSFVYTL